jgi:hypothetical protein
MQDDKDDWIREANKMGAYYQHGFLTIAATRCQNSGESLFSSFSYENLSGTGRNGKRFTVFLNPSGLSYEPSCIPHPGSFPQHDTRFPLLGRAWFFQERLLSKRVIHFLPQELLWECMDKIYCECNWGNHVNFTKTLLQPQSGWQDPGMDIWRHFVQEYTQLNLTYISDRLPALLGLVK